MRSRVVIFNGEWGFLESPIPGEKNIYFEMADHYHAITSGARTRFSQSNPANPHKPPRIPEIGEMILYQFSKMNQGARADRWCYADDWDTAETHYHTGQIATNASLGNYVVTQIEGQDTIFHIFPSNWKPVIAAGTIALIDPRMGHLALSRKHLPRAGDRIVFQVARDKGRMLAKPWTYEDDWAATWYLIRNRT